jgi:hypothetical protein
VGLSVEDALLPRDEKPDEGGVVQYFGHETMEEMSIWAKTEHLPAGRDSVKRLPHRCARFAMRFSSPAKDAWFELFARRLRGFQSFAALGVRMLKMGKSKTRPC